MSTCANPGFLAIQSSYRLVYVLAGNWDASGSAILPECATVISAVSNPSVSCSPF